MDFGPTKEISGVIFGGCRGEGSVALNVSLSLIIPHSQPPTSTSQSNDVGMDVAHVYLEYRTTI